MRIVDKAPARQFDQEARLLVSLMMVLAMLACNAFGLDPQKNLTQYGHRAWQTENGLPQNTVHSVVQTRDGYIWLATEGGLVRFDGVQFAVYDRQAPAHLRSSTINYLFESPTESDRDPLRDLTDLSSDLWIGTEDGLVKRRGEVFTSFSVADGLPSNTIWSILQDRARRLWVVTPEGLAQYQNGRFQTFTIADGIATPASVAEGIDGSFWIGTRRGLQHFNTQGGGRVESNSLLGGFDIRAVAATRDGRVWAGTQSGLYYIDAGKGAAPILLQGLPSNEITSLTNARDGSLWVGTTKGAAAIQGRNIVAAYSAREGLTGDNVESFYQDREGAMWIATNRGVARVFQGHLDAFGAGVSLTGNVVLSVFEDHEGSLWLGTEAAGLDMVHDQKFTTYTAADGLPDDLTRAVIQDKSDESMWVGTNGGGLGHFDHGKFSKLTTSGGLSSDIVLALGNDASGDLWAGTPDGLNRIHQGNIKVLTSADGLVDDFVRSLYAASDGTLWIGTRHGLSHLENGRFTSYSRMDGLGSDLVGAIIEDPDHSLWIATLDGLTHMDHRKFTTLTMRDGLTSNVITALYADQKGSLWIGTNQGGLNRLHDGRITAYPPETTLLPDSIYAILEDAIGNLWLASRTGIYRVAKEQLNAFADGKSASIAATEYGTADGMRIAEASSGGHPAAWKRTDGTMWFATLKGVAAVDPEHLRTNIVPPPVAIDEVLIDDQPVSTSAPLTLTPGKSRFEFHYTGLSFIAPQKVRFRYKLVGFDRDWIDAGSRRTAYYTNLSPGQYDFRVLACNNDGVWNETGAAIHFRLKPHFYQTYWFYLLLAAALALVAYCIDRWRLRQVELRFGAVLSERGRIAREIHDTLAQSLVGISVQLELVNRLLASSVDSARAQLDQARGLVRESLTEARSSIWDLRSQAAETEDFASRLTRMAAAASESSQNKIKIKAKVSGTYRPLSPKVEAELLRIAQEAVTNAVRHAKPTRVGIDLRFESRELRMTIQDDGCGFDGQPHPQSAGPEGHFGLTGMKERAEDIGAALAIESAPGKGTQVSVSLPLES